MIEVEKLDRIGGEVVSWAESVPHRPARIFIYEISGKEGRVSLVNKNSGRIVDKKKGSFRTTHAFGAITTTRWVDAFAAQLRGYLNFKRGQEMYV